MALFRPAFEYMKTWRAGKGPEKIGRKKAREPQRRNCSGLSLSGFAHLPSLVRDSVQELDQRFEVARPRHDLGQTSQTQSNQSNPVQPSPTQSNPVQPSPTSQTQSNQSNPVKPVKPSQTQSNQSNQSNPVKPVKPSQTQSNPVKPSQTSQTSQDLAALGPPNQAPSNQSA
jgi:hypothetical protein